MSRIAVLDFETTGLSPDDGDRATEVAIVLTENGAVVDRYQSLMYAGVRIPSFITDLTGITDAMVRAAPPANVVMAEAARFVGATPIVAHNASFDQRFWLSELRRARVPAAHSFACTLLASRRLYPEAPNHRLGTLVEYHGLPRTGTAHRALADAEMAAALLDRILNDLRGQHGVRHADHGLLMRLQAVSRAAVPAFLAKEAGEGP
ncbi:DNA polymerase III subunit epsilon [Deltaproteobacteria bacterium]|nr:DNA polymerase III subunit epsilon [Deltaproteobacteria bacterium]